MEVIRAKTWNFMCLETSFSYHKSLVILLGSSEKKTLCRLRTRFHLTSTHQLVSTKETCSRQFLLTDEFQ